MYLCRTLFLIVLLALISNSEGLNCKNDNCNDDVEMAAKAITEAPENKSSGNPMNSNQNVLKCYQCSNNKPQDIAEPCTDCLCKDDEQGTVHQIEFE